MCDQVGATWCAHSLRVDRSVRSSRRHLVRPFSESWLQCAIKSVPLGAPILWELTAVCDQVGATWCAHSLRVDRSVRSSRRHLVRPFSESWPQCAIKSVPLGAPILWELTAVCDQVGATWCAQSLRVDRSVRSSRRHLVRPFSESWPQCAIKSAPLGAPILWELTAVCDQVGATWCAHSLRVDCSVRSSRRHLVRPFSESWPHCAIKSAPLGAPILWELTAVCDQVGATWYAHSLRVDRSVRSSRRHLVRKFSKSWPQCAIKSAPLGAPILWELTAVCDQVGATWCAHSLRVDRSVRSSRRHLVRPFSESWPQCALKSAPLGASILWELTAVCDQVGATWCAHSLRVDRSVRSSRRHLVRPFSESWPQCAIKSTPLGAPILWELTAVCDQVGATWSAHSLRVDRSVRSSRRHLVRPFPESWPQCAIKSVTLGAPILWELTAVCDQVGATWCAHSLRVDRSVRSSRCHLVRPFSESWPQCAIKSVPLGAPNLWELTAVCDQVGATWCAHSLRVDRSVRSSRRHLVRPFSESWPQCAIKSAPLGAPILWELTAVCDQVGATWCAHSLRVDCSVRSSRRHLVRPFSESWPHCAIKSAPLGAPILWELTAVCDQVGATWYAHSLRVDRSVRSSRRHLVRPFSKSWPQCAIKSAPLSAPILWELTAVCDQVGATWCAHSLRVDRSVRSSRRHLVRPFSESWPQCAIKSALLGAPILWELPQCAIKSAPLGTPILWELTAVCDQVGATWSANSLRVDRSVRSNRRHLVRPFSESWPQCAIKSAPLGASILWELTAVCDQVGATWCAYSLRVDRSVRSSRRHLVRPFSESWPQCAIKSAPLGAPILWELTAVCDQVGATWCAHSLRVDRSVRSSRRHLVRPFSESWPQCAIKSALLCAPILWESTAVCDQVGATWSAHSLRVDRSVRSSRRHLVRPFSESWPQCAIKSVPHGAPILWELTAVCDQVGATWCAHSLRVDRSVRSSRRHLVRPFSESWPQCAIKSAPLGAPILWELTAVCDQVGATWYTHSLRVDRSVRSSRRHLVRPFSESWPQCAIKSVPLGAPILWELTALCDQVGATWCAHSLRVDRSVRSSRRHLVRPFSESWPQCAIKSALLCAPILWELTAVCDQVGATWSAHSLRVDRSVRSSRRHLVRPFTESWPQCAIKSVPHGAPILWELTAVCDQVGATWCAHSLRVDRSVRSSRCHLVRPFSESWPQCAIKSVPLGAPILWVLTAVCDQVGATWCAHSLRVDRSVRSSRRHLVRPFSESWPQCAIKSAPLGAPILWELTAVCDQVGATWCVHSLRVDRSVRSSRRHLVRPFSESWPQCAIKSAPLGTPILWELTAVCDQVGATWCAHSLRVDRSVRSSRRYLVRPFSESCRSVRSSRRHLVRPFSESWPQCAIKSVPHGAPILWELTAVCDQIGATWCAHSLRVDRSVRSSRRHLVRPFSESWPQCAIKSAPLGAPILWELTAVCDQVGATWYAHSLRVDRSVRSSRRHLVRPFSESWPQCAIKSALLCAPILWELTAVCDQVGATWCAHSLRVDRSVRSSRRYFVRPFSESRPQCAIKSVPHGAPILWELTAVCDQVCATWCAHSLRVDRSVRSSRCHMERPFSESWPQCAIKSAPLGAPILWELTAVCDQVGATWCAHSLRVDRSVRSSRRHLVRPFSESWPQCAIKSAPLGTPILWELTAVCDQVGATLCAHSLRVDRSVRSSRCHLVRPFSESWPHCAIKSAPLGAPILWELTAVCDQVGATWCAHSLRVDRSVRSSRRHLVRPFSESWPQCAIKSVPLGAPILWELTAVCDQVGATWCAHSLIVDRSVRSSRRHLVRLFSESWPQCAIKSAPLGAPILWELTAVCDQVGATWYAHSLRVDRSVRSSRRHLLRPFSESWPQCAIKSALLCAPILWELTAVCDQVGATWSAHSLRVDRSVRSSRRHLVRPFTESWPQCAIKSVPHGAPILWELTAVCDQVGATWCAHSLRVDRSVRSSRCHLVRPFSESWPQCAIKSVPLGAPILWELTAVCDQVGATWCAHSLRVDRSVRSSRRHLVRPFSESWPQCAIKSAPLGAPILWELTAVCDQVGATWCVHSLRVDRSVRSSRRHLVRPFSESWPKCAIKSAPLGTPILWELTAVCDQVGATWCAHSLRVDRSVRSSRRYLVRPFSESCRSVRSSRRHLVRPFSESWPQCAIKSVPHGAPILWELTAVCDQVGATWCAHSLRVDRSVRSSRRHLVRLFSESWPQCAIKSALLCAPILWESTAVCDQVGATWSAHSLRVDRSVRSSRRHLVRPFSESWPQCAIKSVPHGAPILWELTAVCDQVGATWCAHSLRVDRSVRSSRRHLVRPFSESWPQCAIKSAPLGAPILWELTAVCDQVGATWYAHSLRVDRSVRSSRRHLVRPFSESWPQCAIKSVPLGAPILWELPQCAIKSAPLGTPILWELTAVCDQVGATWSANSLRVDRSVRSSRRHLVRPFSESWPQCAIKSALLGASILWELTAVCDQVGATWCAYSLRVDRSVRSSRRHLVRPFSESWPQCAIKSAPLGAPILWEMTAVCDQVGATWCAHSLRVDRSVRSSRRHLVRPFSESWPQCAIKSALLCAPILWESTAVCDQVGATWSAHSLRVDRSVRSSRRHLVRPFSESWPQCAIKSVPHGAPILWELTAVCDQVGATWCAHSLRVDRSVRSSRCHLVRPFSESWPQCAIKSAPLGAPILWELTAVCDQVGATWCAHSLRVDRSVRSSRCHMERPFSESITWVALNKIW